MSFLILATVLSLANGRTFKHTPSDLISITVDIGETTTTVTVSTVVKNTFGVGFGGIDMDNTYSVIYGWDPEVAPQTEVMTSITPRRWCHPIVIAAGPSAGQLTSNWQSAETAADGIRTIVLKRANTVNARECPTCFQFDANATRLNMIWAIHNDDITTGHSTTNRGGLTLTALATYGPVGPPISIPPATTFATKNELIAIEVAVGAITTTVTIQTNSPNAVGVGFGGTDMDRTYAVIYGWDPATAPQTEVMTVQGTVRRAVPHCIVIIIVAGERMGEPTSNWESSETVESGTRTIMLTRDTIVNDTECPTCFQFDPSADQLDMIWAIYYDDVQSGHSARGGITLDAMVAQTTPIPTTPAPVPLITDFATKNELIAIDIAVGAVTTTVTIQTNSPNAVGVGFGGTDMNNTYAVIYGWDPTTSPQTEVMTSQGTLRRPVPHCIIIIIVSGDRVGEPTSNWRSTETIQGGTRTIELTRATTVDARECPTCFQFDPADDQLDIIWAIYYDDVESGHSARGGETLNAIGSPTTTTPAPITPAPITPAPVTPAPVTPAPITPAPTRRRKTPAPITPAPTRRGSKGSPAPTTPAPTRRRTKTAARAPGKGRMVTTTTAAPRRTKSPRTTKTPRVRTKGRTPSPTPMPTEACDCYSTTLVSRKVIGRNKCYRYEVNFCNDDVSTVILGDGEADKTCGIMDVMDIIRSVRLPADVTYESTYRDGKVRGLKLTGLMSGDRFRVCFDKDLVDGVMRAGRIEYHGLFGDVSCKQSGTLPELCPLTVSHAARAGGGRMMRTPSPTPNPTKGVRTKTTRAIMKTTRMRTKTTRMNAKTTRSRVRSKTPRPTTFEPTSYPTPMPTEICDCVQVILVSRNVIGSNKCYRYEVDFCNDDINSITVGDGNADAQCGVDFMDEMTELDVPDEVTYSAVYNDKVRGLKLNGLLTGDKFRICYDKNVVDDTLRGGFIEYFTDFGDFSCKQSDNLPNLCGVSGSSALMSMQNDDIEAKHYEDGSKNPWMIYVWSGLCAAFVSMIAVFIVYISCIKSDGVQVYEKADMESDDEN